MLLGCGSSEVLRVVAEAFPGQGKKFIQATPTFEVCGHHARLSEAAVISVPLDRDFAHDLDRMLARTDNTTALIYIWLHRRGIQPLATRRYDCSGAR